MPAPGLTGPASAGETESGDHTVQETTPAAPQAARQASASPSGCVPAPGRRRAAAAASSRAAVVVSAVVATALSAAACHVPGTSGASATSAPPASTAPAGSTAAPGTGPAQPATAGLTSRGPVHGFTVEIPRGWKHKDETYPSDHSTDVFYDPAHPASKLVLINSGCAGCAGESKRSPLNVLPEGAFNAKLMGKDAATYQRRMHGGPYLGNGVAYIPKNPAQSGPGYVTAEIYLPASQHDLATAILNNIRNCWC